MLRNFKPITAIMLLSLVCVGSFPVHAGNSERAVKVATYNMYLGADFADIFGATSQFELVSEVAEAYTDMQAGNVPERIDEIADQIASGAPEVVGLQEVALWRFGSAFRSLAGDRREIRLPADVDRAAKSPRPKLLTRCGPDKS